MPWEALPPAPSVCSLGAIRLVSAVLGRRPTPVRPCRLSVRLPTRRLLLEYLQVPLIGIPLPPSDLRSTDHEVGHNQDNRNKDQQEDKVSVSRAVAQELLSRAIMWIHLSRAFTTPSGAPSPSAMVRCSPRDGNVRSEISTKDYGRTWITYHGQSCTEWPRVPDSCARIRCSPALVSGSGSAWSTLRPATKDTGGECRFGVMWIWSVQHHAHPPRDVL
jgi:hypothetical protein